MSLLRSVSFSLSQNEKILRNLTTVVADLSDYDREKYKDVLGEEVIEAVFAGKIDSSQPFNLKAYAATVKSNQRMSNAQKAKKTLRIVEDDFDESFSIPAFSIPMAKLPATEGAEAVVEPGLELQEAVKEIRRSNLKVAAKSGVDVIYALVTATRSSGETLKGSQEVVRKVVTEYPELGECITTVLSSGYTIDELFPEEVQEYDFYHNTHRNDSDLVESVDMIRRNRTRMIENASIDIVAALILATRVSGELLWQAEKRLYDFITAYPKFGGYIQTVLSSGCKVDELFSWELRENGFNKMPRLNSESVILTDICASYS